MTKKNIFMTGVAAALAVVYVVFFTDWFQPKTVEIFHITRDLHIRHMHNGVPVAAQPVLIFSISRPLKLTEVKIVPAAAFHTNQYVLPVWHLVSDSNSVPMKAIVYGQYIRGMKPAVPGARAQTLETNVTYHLIVMAGKVRGEHDFELQ